MSAVREFQNHIEAAKKERHHYRECIQEAVKEMESWQGEELKNRPSDHSIKATYAHPQPNNKSVNRSLIDP